MEGSSGSVQATPLRFALWAVLAVGAAWLVFDGGGWFGIYVSDVRLANLALSSALLIVWAATAIWLPAWRPRSALLPALLICLASLAASTITSRSPRVSVEYLGYAVVLVALYLLLVRLLGNAYLRRRLMVVGALIFVVLAADFLVRAFLLWVDWWIRVGGITVPPLRPNFIGLSYANPSAVLTMVALLAVPAAYLMPVRLRVAGISLVLGLVALVALMSGSRAGWLALAVSGLVSVGIGVGTSSGRAVLARLLRRIQSGELRLQLAVAASVVIGVSVLTVILLPPIYVRTGAGGEGLRTTLSIVALRIFSTAPLLGTGPGTWVIERVASTQTAEIDYYIPHAHDVPVQTLAELGLAGAVAGAFLIASVAALLYSAWRSPSSDRRWLAWLTFAGLLYLAVHDLLDFYPNFPAVLFAAALPVAYLDATSEPAALARWIGLPVTAVGGFLARRPVVIACAVLVAAALAGLILQEIPAQQNERATTAADRGDWAAAVAPARAAAAADPGIHAYAMTAGLAAARAGDASTAAELFGVVARADDLPEAWLDLASVEADQNHAQEAMAALAAALRVGVQHPPIAMAAGDLYLRLGAEKPAVSAFASAIARRPSLAADPWWQADSTRKRLHPTIVTEAIADASVDGKWEIALMVGDTDVAQVLAGTTSLQGLATQITAAWGGDATAAASLFSGCEDNPLDVTRVLWCARIASRMGSAADAERFRAIAGAVDLGATERSAELRVLSSSPVAWVTNETAIYWGLYTYRRPTPRDILVPGLLHLELK